MVVATGRIGRLGLGMAFQGERIHLLARQVPRFRDVLRGLRHGGIGRRVQQIARELHGEVLVVVRVGALLLLGQGQHALVGAGDGRLASLAGGNAPPHALHPHRDAGLAGAGHDLPRDHVQGLHAGAALPVHRDVRDLRRQVGQPRDRVGRHGRQLAAPQHVAGDHVLQLVRVHLRIALQQGAHHLARNLVHACRHETPLGATAERGAQAVHDDYVFQFHRRSCVSGSATRRHGALRRAMGAVRVGTANDTGQGCPAPSAGLVGEAAAPVQSGRTAALPHL